MEKAEALKSITAELRVNRKILIAEREHQCGAYQAATLTNITFTKVREAAKGDLLALGLSTVKRRAGVVQHDVQSLRVEVPFPDVNKQERCEQLGWKKITAKSDADFSPQTCGIQRQRCRAGLFSTSPRMRL
jgi:hypothetical protein